MLGVYLPTIQHILGLMMFIRHAWVVGCAGVLEGFAMVFMCCLTVRILCCVVVQYLRSNNIYWISMLLVVNIYCAEMQHNQSHTVQTEKI